MRHLAVRLKSVAFWKYGFFELVLNAFFKMGISMLRRGRNDAAFDPHVTYQE
jgi:hypothetical protein